MRHGAHEVGARIVHPTPLDVRRAQEGFLQHVLGIAHRTQESVRERLQFGAMGGKVVTHGHYAFGFEMRSF